VLFGEQSAIVDSLRSKAERERFERRLQRTVLAFEALSYV
jgi:hypothetical protein